MLLVLSVYLFLSGFFALCVWFGGIGSDRVRQGLALELFLLWTVHVLTGKLKFEARLEEEKGKTVFHFQLWLKG